MSRNSASSRKKPLYVSFYTPKYKKLAKRLEESFQEFGLIYHLFDLPDQGSWVRNCGLKPFVIRGSLLEYDRPIVFIDSDAVVRQYPALFDHMNEDFGAHWLSRKGRSGKELLSGTIFINNTKGGHELMELWVDRQGQHMEEWDQRNLSNILHKANITIRELPATYTQIYDTMKGAGDPVIEHFQESRKHRGK